MLLLAQRGEAAWHSVPFEYNSSGWYMPGLPGVSPVGLWAREGNDCEMRIISERTKSLEKASLPGYDKPRFSIKIRKAGLVRSTREAIGEATGGFVGGVVGVFKGIGGFLGDIFSQR